MRHPLLGFLVSALLSEGATAAEPLTLYYHERAPYAQARDGGEVRGLTATRAADALHDAGIAFRWARLPAKRQAQVIAENKERACALGWFATPERRAIGRFSAPLYQDMPLVVLTRADHPVLNQNGVRTADILADRRLTALFKEAYSYGIFVDDLIARLAPRSDLTVAENDAMIHMLLRARADYLFMTEEEANHLIRVQKLDPASFRIIRPRDMPPGSTRHLWCTRRVGDAELQAIDLALNPRAAHR